MTDTLILYRADDIDAECAKMLLLERWPNAEAIADPDVKGVIVTDDPPNERVVEPTADACVAMQVWRRLHPCGPCDGTGDDCNACGGNGVSAASQPPMWLRYLDDAVCGRWELPRSRSAWACISSYDPPDAARLLAGWNDWRNRIAWEGDAILRARKRWDAETDVYRDAIVSALKGERDSLRAQLRNHRDEKRDTLANYEERFRDLGSELQREKGYAAAFLRDLEAARAERDGFAQTILRLEGERRELLADLRTAIAMIYDMKNGDTVDPGRLAALCQAAEIEP